MAGTASLRIGRVLGIPIDVHASLLLTFGVIVWSLGASYFPGHQPGIDGGTSWSAAIITALLFFGSVVAHELAHSLVARSRGIAVERITLFALGGVSESKGDARGPRVELAVAVVGPLASLALAGLLFVSRSTVSEDTTIGAIVSYLAYGNVALGVFNLIPGFPLDGGRVLRAVLWARSRDFGRATIAAARVGRVAATGLVLTGIWLVFTAPGTTGLWLLFVGWFLSNAAEQEATRTLIEERLRGRSIAPLARFEFITLDPEETIARAAARIVAAPPQALYPVRAGESVLGMLTLADFNGTAQELWPTTKLFWLVRRARAIPSVDLDTDALDALTRIDALQVDGLPVRDASGVVALVERPAIVQWVQAATARL